MPQANWLLESDRFDENLDRLKQSIEKSGSKYKTFDYIPFDDKQCESITSLFPDREPVVFYGSLNAASRIRKHAKWVPGVYCDLAQFECFNYYNHFGEFLLNSDYVMLSLGELERQHSYLYSLLNTDKLFIRPSSGFKTFDGSVVAEKCFYDFLKRATFYENNLKDIIVISAAKDIVEEWRLIIVDNTVVSASQYKNEGMVKIKEGCPTEVIDFTNRIAKKWRPESAYTMDICRRKDGPLRLIEINSFSCSGFYAAPTDTIVEAVNRAALRDYQDIYGV